jgi:hypothetical protein
MHKFQIVLKLKKHCRCPRAFFIAQAEVHAFYRLCSSHPPLGKKKHRVSWVRLRKRIAQGKRHRSVAPFQFGQGPRLRQDSVPPNINVIVGGIIDIQIKFAAECVLQEQGGRG